MATLLARGQITIAAIRDGAPGPQGKPGKDAVSIIVEDAPLVFDTDDNGIVSPGTSKTAKVKVMKGNQNVSNQCIGVSSRDDMCVNCKCYVTQEDGYITVSVSGNIIAKDDVVVDGVNHVVSATSGYAVAQAAYDGVTYFAQVPFSINVAKFTGIVAFDNKSYKSKFKEVSNRLDGAATKYELTQAKSEIEQTAREISLSVSEKSIGRRNMLVGSACRKYRDGFIYMSGAESQYYDGYPLEQIEKNSGIDGVNCIHCRTKQTGTNRYYLSGFRWFGNSPQGNIKLEKGKNYVLSFYAKTHTPNDIYFTAEVLYQGSKIDTSRPAGYSGPIGYSTTFAASEADKWELFTVKVSVPSNAPYEYVEINIFARARSYSFVDGYICKPMLEEGENYNGWTLSEQDYDYVGGNLLDNARTLDKSGTLTDTNDTVIQNGYGTDSACIKNLMKANATPSDYKEVLRWRFGSTYLVNGNDYIFSFVAKADVDNARVVCYMWSGDIENSSNIFTEGNGGAWDSQADGNIVFILSRQWTRYWVHWRPKDGYATPKQVLIRHTGNNSTSASTVYVAQPKLEIGATMTEWTERKSDLIDKASLKKAGIEVKSDEVLLYGDRIRVDNNGQTAAMFIGGKLNANLIDADKIEVKHLWAKSEDGTTKVGYFGNYEIEACKVDDTTYAPLFVGGDTASQSSFYVSSEGAMYATSGYIGGFNIGKTSIDGINGQNKVMLTPGYISFDNKTHGIDNIIGANWKYGLDYVGQQIVVKYDHATPSYGGNIGIANLKNIALYVSASGNIDRLSRDTGVVNSVYPCGNHAIFCDKGDFAGFRPCFRIITSSQTLSKYDVVVEIVETWKKHNSITGEDTSVEVGPVTISLPTNPEIGQMYWIIRSTRHNYSMKTTDGTQIYTPGGVTTFYTFKTQNEMVCVVYTGSNWRVMWNMGV